jgi:hypothetical protein
MVEIAVQEHVSDHPGERGLRRPERETPDDRFVEQALEFVPLAAPRGMVFVAGPG